MKTVNVILKENSYKIVIGRHILGRLGAALKSLHCGKDAVIITSPVISRHHGAALASGLQKNGFSVKVFEVPEGEQSKSARVAFSLMEKIARYDRLKEIFIIAFGGGVIGDLAGYVAAAYKRGVPYVQVPTTLLAQIDSAIGGKTAIDLPVGKNLAGAFYQPKIVWSDVSVLATLDKRQIRNGLAEAVKYGVIADAGLFGYIARHYAQILDLRPSALEETVLRCSRIKARVVSADEKETRGIRTILNFGHTIGHAIEAAAGYRLYHHGESVALGMRVAAEISSRKGMLPAADYKKINGLISDIGLPRKIQGVSLTNILRVMDHDKKFRQGKNRFVLAQAIGKVKVVADIAPTVIQKAIRLYM
ncbi:MAG: 3-dehydroquinate synthase [Candidatus Omnitrophica bacterium]|nr:3-dehydroquinate synthase [Candidatus Omnitrophota bacterium]